MIIQLQAPKDSVNEWVVNYLSTKLVNLHRKHPQITKAKVYLREPAEQEKSCTVGLKVNGVSLLVNRSAASFSKACYHVMVEVENKLKQIFKKKNRIDKEKQVMAIS